MQGVPGHASSFLDCFLIAHACRSQGLRPRCRKQCLCDVRTFVVAQRCVSGSRNPWSRLRLRFVGSVSGVQLHRQVYGLVVRSRVAEAESPWSVMSHTHMCVSEARKVRDHGSGLKCWAVAPRDAHMCVANACAAIYPYTYIHIYINMQRTRDRCLCTHMCVAETRNRWSCFRLPFVLMFECGRVCDFTQMCVADACRRVYCGRGCCCELDACHFFACKNTYAHAHARACLRSKQKTQGLGQ